MFAALAFFGGVALDLDHVLAAGSFSPRAMEHLGHRPVTHSLLLAVVFALLVLGILRSKLVAWSVFAVIVSHVLFDAAGGNEYWLYPLSDTDSLPWIACPVGTAILYGISAVAARAAPPRMAHIPRPH